MKPEYVLIFIFDPDDRVLLRKKDHPVDQAGKWNGIGGRITGDDADESINFPNWLTAEQIAAERKIQEEVGIGVPSDRIRVPIQVEYPSKSEANGGVTLHVGWVELEELAVPFCAEGPCPQEPEYNRWFSRDEQVDIANEELLIDGEKEEAVGSVWEFIELIRSIKRYWA